MSLRETEIQYLPGVGPKRAEALKAEFGVSTASGLLRIYPYRYMDRSRLTPISDVRSGAAVSGQLCCIIFNHIGESQIIGVIETALQTRIEKDAGKSCDSGKS